MAKHRVWAAALLSPALAVTFLSAGCGEFINNNDDALYELTGRWYNNRYDFAFEITQTGEGYIADSKTQCTVTFSGNFVYFRDSRNNLMGSFYYSLKNGELTMTLAGGDFSGMESSSPFIKSGSTPSGGRVPVEFIGRWYAKSNPPASPNFEITKSGEITISPSEAPCTAIVSGNTVSVLEGSRLKGQFQSTFIYGEMIITNGTDLCAGLAVLSHFVKKNS